MLDNGLTYDTIWCDCLSPLRRRVMFLYPWAVAHWSAGTAPAANELPLPAAGIPANFEAWSSGKSCCSSDPGRGLRLRMGKGFSNGLGNTIRRRAPGDRPRRRTDPGDQAVALSRSREHNPVVARFGHQLVPKYSLWRCRSRRRAANRVDGRRRQPFDIARSGAEVMRHRPVRLDDRRRPRAMKICLSCNGSGSRCQNRSGASAWAHVPRLWDFRYLCRRARDRPVHPVDVYIPGCPLVLKDLRALMISRKDQRGARSVHGLARDAGTREANG